MFDNIENLKLISILHRPNQPYRRIDSRQTHSIFIRAQGAMRYDFQDKQFLVKEGDMIFIPKGSSYTARLMADTGIYTGIHFQWDHPGALQPKCYSLEDFYEADYLTNCISDMWNLGTQAEKYQCFSLFYSLLSYLSAKEHADRSTNSSLHIIDPAITYLKEHIYDCELKVDALPRLCGISNTYFRKIFTSRFHTTPQKYIQSKRISHAKSILSSKDFSTIEEVALSVGFRDPLYFSKVFKKAYGVSPSTIGKD